MSNTNPVRQNRPGDLGVTYICGDATGGRLEVVDAFQGKKILGIHGKNNILAATIKNKEIVWADKLACLRPKYSSEYRDCVTNLINLQQIAFGDSYCLAITQTGQLYTWGKQFGKYSQGELGRTSSSRQSSRSQKLLSARNFRSESIKDMQVKNDEISASSITNEGEISHPKMLYISQSRIFIKVACGKRHSAAIADNGDLYTWGSNFKGQLGHFFSQKYVTGDTLTPKAYAIDSGVRAWPTYVRAFFGKPPAVDVCCGENFTVVLLDHSSNISGDPSCSNGIGGIYHFGERFNGNSIEAPRRNHAEPILLETNLSTVSTQFTAIASGIAHFIAVTTSGNLWGWGMNTFGQLGRGKNIVNSKAQPPFAPMADLVAHTNAKFDRVYAGGNFSCALTTTGQLYTWGNGAYGKLAHDTVVYFDQHRAMTAVAASDSNEYNPRIVDALSKAVITDVVCLHKTLVAFCPTRVTKILPECASIDGKYFLTIYGCGFYPSDDLTIRFVPQTEGLLPRGSLGTYNIDTQNIVCQVPEFAHAGKFAIEVSCNGQDFTSNGVIFETFRVPDFINASCRDVNFEGGKNIVLRIKGVLPEQCHNPLVKFIPQERNELSPEITIGTVTPIVLSEDEESDYDENGNDEEFDDEDYISRHSPIPEWSITITTPSFSCSENALLCKLEVSYNNGHHFYPIEEAIRRPGGRKSRVKSYLKGKPPSSDLQPVIITYHDAHVINVTPNSFLINELPQPVSIHVHHLIPVPLSAIKAKLTVVSPQFCTIRASDSKSGVEQHFDIEATLNVIEVNGYAISCIIPPMENWKCKELLGMGEVNGVPNGEPDTPFARIKAKAITSFTSAKEWWRYHLDHVKSNTSCSNETIQPTAAWGFELAVSMSINNEVSVLPSTTQLYALQDIGNISNLSPSKGFVVGGTSISIEGDFLYFDTKDAVLLIQWNEQSLQTQGVCESIVSADDTEVKRVLRFRMPEFTFDPTLPTPKVQNPIISNELNTQRSTNSDIETDLTSDNLTSGEDEMQTVRVLQATEIVKLNVSIDGGRHFTTSSLTFTYFEVPELLEIIEPTDCSSVPSGTLIKIKCANISATIVCTTIEPTTCIRLTAASFKLPVIVSDCEIIEEKQIIVFRVPELPVLEAEPIKIGFSIDGENFIERIQNTAQNNTTNEVSTKSLESINNSDTIPNEALTIALTFTYKPSEIIDTTGEATN